MRAISGDLPYQVFFHWLPDEALPEDFTPMAKLLALNGTKVANQMGIDPMEVFKGKVVSQITTPTQYWNQFKNIDELQNAFDAANLDAFDIKKLEEKETLSPEEITSLKQEFKKKYGFDINTNASEWYYSTFNKEE